MCVCACVRVNKQEHNMMMMIQESIEFSKRAIFYRSLETIWQRIFHNQKKNMIIYSKALNDVESIFSITLNIGYASERSNSRWIFVS